MKKALILFLVISSYISSVSARQAADIPKGNAKISGKVVDGETNQPVEFANLVLIDTKTSKAIDGTVCDTDGKFTLTKVAEGIYNLSVTFIGYETQVIENVSVDKRDEIEIPTIKLSTGAKVLNEVVVEGQRSLIEEKVDRTVYNAEQDATTRGGDATDVLKRVPMLSVDMDGNVSMRGNSNILVLINNKPSTITASSVADALKQIPADQIKSVEVITSPSAKYDAEGSAGIINIITKKNTLQGATLNVDAGVGLRGSNLGLNGNYRKGKMGFSLGGFGRASYNVKGSFENNQVTTNLNDTNNPNDDTFVTTRQFSDSRRNDLNGRYTLGWDYDINKHNYLAASVRYGMRNGHNYQDNLTRYISTEPDPSVQDSKTIDNSGTVDVSLDFTHTYEKPQRELSFSTQFSRNNRDNDIFNTFYEPSSTDIDRRTKNVNQSFNQEVTAQLDYQTPVKENQMLELGVKNISRKVSSDYKFLEADGSDGPFESSGTVQSNNALDYNQNVTAGYLSYTLALKNGFSTKAGARYEYTIIDAAFQSTDEDVSDIPSYGVLVPSINLSKKLKNGNTIKLSYNRRIQRPSIQFLNPNLQRFNNYSESKGNPNLGPEYTNNYELGYSTFIKGTTLNFSAFMRNTTESIQSIRQVVQDTIIRTTYANIGKEDAYGLSVFSNVSINNKFTLNGGGDIYYAVLNNNNPDPLLAATNEGWVWSGRLFGSYSLPKNWAIQFFGFYRGNRVSLQGSQGGFGTYSMGIRKEFNEKRASIGIAAENFFTTEMKIRSETHTPTIDQNSINTMRNMSVRITFSYRIGKMGFDGAQRQRRRKSVSNDDLKDGGDGDIGQNGGGQGQRGTSNAAPTFSQPVQAKPIVRDTTQYASNSTSTVPDSLSVNASGTWNYTVESPQGQNTGSFTLTKENGMYKGTVTSARMSQLS
jgi:outer membrane receptor protein involved in Fe transport